MQVTRSRNGRTQLLPAGLTDERTQRKIQPDKESKIGERQRLGDAADVVDSPQFLN